MNHSVNHTYPFEVVTVTTSEVTCDGGSPATGHPQVFLHIDPKTQQVICPYCSRLFVKAPS